MKTCSKCGSTTNPFPKDRSTCIPCRTLYHKEWQIKNSEHYTQYHREYQNERQSIDPSYKLQRYLRKRLNSAISSSAKAGSAIHDLGCSLDELKVYLQSKFQQGMSWDNYGEWHIDHIRPLSKFDLSSVEQFKEACHYTNLQPLWAKENLAKHDKV